MEIEIVNIEHVGNSAAKAKAALVESFMTGAKITAPNENPVDVTVPGLEPFMKIRKPSRSSRVYDRVE